MENEKEEIATWHIHLKGQVQGLGFRPYIFRIAHQRELNGWVNNAADGVHIEINATEKTAGIFYQELITHAPSLAQLTSHSIHQKEPIAFEGFQIVQSHSAGEPNLLLTPDLSLCKACRQDMQTDHNRRRNYPFTTCTNCGPRFSIMAALPYDRESTTMAAFKMCAACSEEYHDPLNRRYFSQTNSCWECSIQLRLVEPNLQQITPEPDKAMQKVVQYWEAGKIVAIKGIGGYLLTCDAANKAAIQELRSRKHRPAKPFALMFPDLESLEKLVKLRKNEREALTSHVAPIVLLEIKQAGKGEILHEEIAPGLNQVGVMLPYAPLYQLLLQKYKKPIIATSGNSSNSPIQFKDDIALKELFTIADLILVHNRSITVPQDDSIIKFTPIEQQRIMLRRARGLAPTYINADLEWQNQTILASGGTLKSTFTLLHKGNTYISQYLGDLEQFDTQQNYQLTIQHFFKLFDARPDLILIDKHPQYASMHDAAKLANELHVPLYRIQHHEAHFGAVLGENNLVHATEPVLGVIWDGTGYGNDGQIWGGEFFRYENYRFTRSCHIDYFDLILGDKMSKEPRISALAACWKLNSAAERLKEKFTETEWQVYTRMLQKGGTLKTSSVGRIFDAAASLLGLLDIQTFEGEAAMLLETLAWKYFQEKNTLVSDSYFFKDSYSVNIPVTVLLRGILHDLQEGKPKDLIAAKLHFSFMDLVRIVATNLNIKKIAFSGGVFQNSLLLELISFHLKDAFELYFHKELSPNDENVSFGQLVCYQILNMKP